VISVEQHFERGEAMTRERRAWTEFVEKRESEKKAKRPRAKKREVPQAELEAALDDLVSEAEQRRSST
jgi:hypothetical protein